MTSSVQLPDNAVWLVTGTSSGIGASLLSSILTYHPTHRVVALSRNPASILVPPTSTPENTLLLAVDLSSEASITTAFDSALAHFGRIDVVVNNAGYGVLGEFESVPTSAGRSLFEINFWAAVHLTRLAMAAMRDANPRTGPTGGVIAQVSSVGGYIAAPGQTFYHASKWALEGFTESVAKEVDPAWAIRFVVFEPGSVRTRWSGENQKGSEYKQHEAYRRPKGSELPLEKMRDIRGAVDDKIGASSDAVADVIVGTVVDAEGKWGGKELLRLPLGADAWTLVKADVGEVGESLEKWKAVSESTSPGDVKETLRSIGLYKD